MCRVPIHSATKVADNIRRSNIEQSFTPSLAHVPVVEVDLEDFILRAVDDIVSFGSSLCSDSQFPVDLVRGF